MDPLALSAGRLHQQALAAGVAVELIAKVLEGLGVEVVAVVASVGQVQLGHRGLRKHFCSAYSANAAG